MAAWPRETELLIAVGCVTPCQKPSVAFVSSEKRHIVPPLHRYETHLPNRHSRQALPILAMHLTT